MSKEKTALKPIDTPVYGYWSALYRSFYSRRLYVDIGKRWKGFGALYLLLVIAILSVPFFFRMSISLDESFKEQIVNPLLKIPVFYIQNGNVLFDKPMPYFIKNDKGQTVVIIDTTGIINDFTAQYPYLNILINKNQIAFRIPNPQLFNMNKEAPPSRSTPIVQTFDKGANLVFDGKKMVEANSVTGLKYASQAVLYPIIVGIFFSIFIVFFLVFALLGQTFSSIFFSFKIPFATSSRLLMVAGTPMLLVLMTILSLNSVFTGLGILLFCLLIAYYSFALYALRAESRRVALV
ncbi:DUF1189 family protein [Legionella lytica]|uniref:DUF1189 family protein n=1 Tax=Legionella lytica TaxID=96232 RepID=A0ABY4Y4P1_9GAMM|nr:DUF1189 family protein [Legionella lytica]USQ12585.1 DUF1189 family protein [Legionella lytica]